MNIAFIWYFDKASRVYDNWRDGHRAMIDVLVNEGHKVDMYLDKSMPEPGEYDVLLFWASSNEDFFQELDRYQSEIFAICLTTNPHNPENLKKMDVIFVESTPVLLECQQLGLHTVKAFGTDTDFFSPDPKVKKDIKYFYPATFSPWKLQRNIAHYGEGLLCVGTVQPDGLSDLQACEHTGVQIRKGYFPAEEIRDYYRRAKQVVVPAIHGSERTVLETMSMDMIPRVNPENKKANSYFDELRNSNFESPRAFILDRYSHKKFAHDIIGGLKSCFQS